MATQLKGLEEVNRNLKRELERIGGELTEDFVTATVMQIRARSAALTPIDSSFLINSAFHRVYATPSGYAGEMGYGAKYAAAVHEMPGTLKGQPRADFGMTSNRSEFGPTIPTAFGGGSGQGNYWDPNAEPKFLEKGVQEVIEQDLDAIIARSYKI